MILVNGKEVTIVRRKSTAAALRQAQADDKRLGERLKYLVEDMRARADSLDIVRQSKERAAGMYMAIQMVEDFLRAEGGGRAQIPYSSKGAKS